MKRHFQYLLVIHTGLSQSTTYCIMSGLLIDETTFSMLAVELSEVWRPDNKGGAGNKKQ